MKLDVDDSFEGRTLHHGQSCEVVVDLQHVGQTALSHCLSDLVPLNVELLDFQAVVSVALTSLSKQVLQSDFDHSFALQQFYQVDLLFFDLIKLEIEPLPHEDAASLWIEHEAVRLNVLFHLADSSGPTTDVAECDP